MKEKFSEGVSNIAKKGLLGSIWGVIDWGKRKGKFPPDGIRNLRSGESGRAESID